MEMPVFDLSLPKLLILAVLALVVFGPNELPKMASQAGRFLRELRKIADGAQADLREGLGPDFADFDLTDLSPRRFVQKHLLSDLDEPDLVGAYSDETRAGEAEADNAAAAAEFDEAGEPVFDAEAT